MNKQIIINASKDRSRIAIVENGELVELYVENPDNVRTIGNVYLGRVHTVPPHMKAAFVDIGQKKDCFLHFSDLTDNLPQVLALAGEDVPGLDEPVLSLAPAKRVADDEDEPDVDETLEVESSDESSTRRKRSRRSRGRGRRRGRGGSGRTEEEEEQEESGERRPLPSVIDLTAPPTPRRRPASRPTPEEPAGDASETETSGTSDPAGDSEPTGDRSAPVEDKPRRRASTRSRGDAKDTSAEDATPSEDEESPAVETPEAGSSGDESSASETGSEATEADGEAKPKRRRRRRRRGRGKGTKPQGDTADPPDADSSDAGQPAEAPRAQTTEAPAETAEAPAGDDTSGDHEPSDEASRKPLPSTLDLTSRPSDRSRSSKGARRSRQDDGADTAPERASADKDGGKRRSRRNTSETSDASTDSAETKGRSSRGRRSSSGDKPAADAKQSTSSGKGNDTSKTRGSSGGRDRSNSSESGSGRGRGSDRKSSSNKETSSRGGNRGRNGSGKGNAKKVEIPPAEQLLKRDTKILVKITKEAISTKGPRVSTDLSLAGRFLVLVPAADYVAVSKKIESSKERKRLRTLATSLKPDGFGVIVRTVAKGRDAKSLDTDLRLLTDRWRKIEKKLKGNPEPPVLLYEDVNMVSSIIRDLFSDDFDRILVDDPKVFKRVQAYVKAVAPSMAEKVELHTGRQPVFRSVGIEKQVEEAFSRRVNMKGGGYLYIETTEAMHVVDVNSGRAGRGKSQKQNLIDVNVAAAKEIAKQLRLRDLGGIIVVDFIDLKYDRDRRKVTDALKEEFKKDRAVTKLLPMSDFGLVQITRQRLRPSITTQSADDEATLDGAEAKAAAGAGEIRRQRAPEAEAERPVRREEAERPSVAPEDVTPQALAGRLRGWLDHYRRTVGEKYRKRPIVVRVHPLFGAYLRRGFPSPLTRWRLSLRGITFVIEQDPAVDPLAFDVRDQKSGRSLLKKYAS
ncbi:MAG: Rne/Rng family ribonuclease [Bacteroidota bacterium]